MCTCDVTFTNWQKVKWPTAVGGMCPEPPGRSSWLPRVQRAAAFAPALRDRARGRGRDIHRCVPVISGRV